MCLVVCLLDWYIFCILEPIQSRCALVKFTRLEDKEVRTRVIQVCELEKVDFIESGVQAIIATAQGDMRQVDIF